MHTAQTSMLKILAQIPGIPDDVSEIVDTADVTKFDFLWALITLVLAVVGGRVGRMLIRRYARKAGLSPNIVDLLGTIVMWSLMAIGTVIALTFLGLAIAPLWLLIVFVVAAFVIGGRSLLEAFGAGILLQARAPFEQGDFVKLGEDSGVVVEVNSRVVVLDAVDGRRLYIPNTKVLQNTIENLTHRKLRMSVLYLDVEYGTDLDRAIELAEASGADLDALLARPRPEAQVSSFAESSVQIAYRFWHEPTVIDEWNAIDAAARAVYKAYADNDIVFAFPNATLWWGNRTDDPTKDGLES
jgi:small conductance mechanosensitive channel